MVMGRRTEVGLTTTRLVSAELVTLATGPGATPAALQTYRLRPDGDRCGLDYRLALDGVPAERSESFLWRPLPAEPRA
jgi:hypothetical protein